MASKNVIADLNKGDRLNGDNFHVWSFKIRYVLEEQEVLEAVNHVLENPGEGHTPQHRRAVEAYQSWKKADATARGILVSSMVDDLACEYKDYSTACELWKALNARLGGTSVTRLRQLTIRFDTYQMRPNHSVKQHLREMSRMIRELSAAGHNLTDEQQVQAVIRSLPNSWEHMKVNLTHNESIKTFEDATRHVELEDERLGATKENMKAYVAESSQKPSGSKGKKFWKKKNKRGKDTALKPKGNKFKRSGKKQKDVSKLKCYNCGKKGHFARDCNEPKKVTSNSTSIHMAYVSSTVLLVEPNPWWIVDSGATDHVARDRGDYIEYRRVPGGSKWIYVGNNARIEVKGIGTCKLELRGGRTLLLHDVLFAPEIRRNLVSVISLIKLGYDLHFKDIGLFINYGTVCYGFGQYVNGFAVLDVKDVYHQCYSVASSSNAYNDDVTIWHARLGHIGKDRMEKLAREGLLGSLEKIDLPLCEPCLAGKATRKPFGKGKRADYALQLIHSDICGPMNVRARHGASYFITFIDDFTRFGKVFLISHKSEALECFRLYLIEVENQLNKKVKTLRTDRGREYLSDQFKDLCNEKGITRQLTIPGTPQQNGVAERRNRTLLE